MLTLANLMFGLRDALMADRYVYLPAAGAFLLLAYGFHQLQARAPWLRTLLGATLAVYVAGSGLPPTHAPMCGGTASRCSRT